MNPAPPGAPRERRDVLWVLAFWALVGVLFSSTTWLRAAADGAPIPLAQAAAVQAADVLVWAAVTLAALGLSRRFPLERGRWRRTLPVHLAAGLAVVLLRALVLHLFYESTGWFPSRTPAQTAASLVPPNLVTYWMLVGVAHAVDFARRDREREVRAARLESQLARAQLQVLQMQLHPHFLFNTLHAVSSLVRRDPDAAERMIANLSELLRATLARGQTQEVTVAEEVELLGAYLEIETCRLGDRLALEVGVDPATRTALLPGLLLQPLVENAVRHGVAPLRRGGRVEVSVARLGDELEIVVRDDGRGFSPGAPPAPGGGVGLANTRARLERLYGPAHRLEIDSAPGRGARVRIRIPFRVAEPARPPALAEAR